MERIFFFNVFANFLMFVIPDYIHFCGRAARRFIVLARFVVLEEFKVHSLQDELNSGLYLAHVSLYSENSCYLGRGSVFTFKASRTWLPSSS